MERRPIFKNIHPVYEVQPGLLRLGELVGTAVELDDPNGSIEQMIRMMDGTRTSADLHQALLADYPELTRAEVEGALEALHELGFLYDQCLEEQVTLTAEERDRYKGNLNLFAHYANFSQSPGMIQERLKNAKVTVLGMGAFGSSLLFQLAGLGVGQVRIVDFDTVELSNLNRQMLFSEPDLGRLKIDVAKEFMARFNSTMQIETVELEIRSSADVERVIAGSDLVIQAADQPFFILMQWVNKAVVKHNIPLVGGGIQLSGGTMYAVLPGKSGCMDCMLLRRTDEAEDYPEIVERFLQSRYIPPNSATAPTLMQITSHIGMEALRILTGIGEVLTAGKLMHYDFMTWQQEVMTDFERDEDRCPTCGHGDPNHPVFRIAQNSDFSGRPVVPR